MLPEILPLLLLVYIYLYIGFGICCAESFYLTQSSLQSNPECLIFESCKEYTGDEEVCLQAVYVLSMKNVHTLGYSVQR